MNEEARRIRVEWMTKMGLDPAEIAEALNFDPPVSVEDEQDQLDYLNKLRAMDMSWLKELNVVEQQVLQDEMENVKPLDK